MPPSSLREAVKGDTAKKSTALRLELKESPMNKKQKSILYSSFLTVVLGAIYVPVGTPTTYGRNRMEGYRWVWSTEGYVVNTAILYVHLAVAFAIGVILFNLSSRFADE